MTDRTTTFPSSIASVRKALERRLGIDPRALAALRISLGILLLVDLGLRARDLATFYSDAGVFPRTALASAYPAFSSISIHAMSGEVWVQAVLFLVAAGFATALLVGYRTRLATIASFVLLVSLHARNPMVLNAGDVVFRRVLFWSIFLPLGGRWAVDARRSGGREDWVAGLATTGLLVQVVLIYFTNVAFKLRTDVWLRGDAMRYVFELDQFTFGLAAIVSRYPPLLELLAWGWFALIVSSVLLVVLTGRARTIFASMFVAGHVGMLLTMDLGIFPLVSIAGLLPFFSPSVWDWVEERLRPVRSRLGRWVSTVDRWLRTPDWPNSSFSLPRWTRTIRSAVLAFLIAAILLQNVVAVGLVDQPSAVPDAVSDRSWNMFGNPPQSEGWYVGHGTFDSGRQVSSRVFSTRLDRHPDAGTRYPAARWRKYQSKLAASDDERLYAYLATDICRRWTAAAGHPLQAVTLEHVREDSRLDGPDERGSGAVRQYACVTSGN